MDPFSALIFAMVASWAIMRSAAEAGVEQAKAEARQAAAAIRKDLNKRQKAWAKQLNDRLEEGRKGGPATAMWWGWAAFRTARGIHRALRNKPREAEKRAIRGETGPFGRIFGAAWRGAKYARQETRRQRQAHERAARVPVGVCGRCGAVTAKAALVWALTRFGRQEQMCAKCRAFVDAKRNADAAATKPDRTSPGPDVADADVVHEPPREIGTPAPEEPNDPPMDEPKQTSSAPEPEPREEAPETTWTLTRLDEEPTRQPDPKPSVETAERPALEGSSTPEGEPMAPKQLAPYRPGVPVPRRSQLTRSGGDSYTHGAWNRAVTDVERRLDALPALLEAMLSSLTTAEAGREQVKGVFGLRDDIVVFMGQVRDMLTDVNRREMPVVEAVTIAGGPDEIPSISYLADV